ncbi:DUF72 domain-containing protein [Staphylococcus sp. SQ8-PEA]|uniref:DUF72 domain-containing protein n=1 Tax=Staphylococcus marylandisciuri TaxID=2981529 RepID=A0ABT2QPN6_9STAP|nr:DUF72 domain-containing protein [Staphylococcus marylandisciuri]MCU5745928.1 DUF72 domain-containing protein [Staphylococcus marylandisciuri]
MIEIGLTGWGDHHSLYEDVQRSTDKLKTYASHFPVVELDATYYAVQPERNIQKWIKETPQRFKFVVKSHQALTLHADYQEFATTRQELFDEFKTMLSPLIQADKLAMVLVQFPPWFECSVQNINYVRYVREQLKGLPMCVEFRHQSWFSSDFKEDTLNFLTHNSIIHSVCDEPQVGQGCIPLVNRVTQDIALVRYHGRNVHGWTKQDMTDRSWREVRYLYNYSTEELKGLAQKVKILEQKTKKVYVVFNNNSGGHAAQNAQQFQEILGIEYEGLAPQQLSLF